MTTNKKTTTKITNSKNKNGNVQNIDIDIDLDLDKKKQRKRKSGPSKAEKDKIIKEKIQQILRQIENERGRVQLERHLITERVGFAPPIPIPSMPPPVANLNQMEEQLEYYLEQLALIQDDMIGFYERMGATERDIQDLRDEVDREFQDMQDQPPVQTDQATQVPQGQTLGGMPTGQPPIQQPQPIAMPNEALSPPIQNVWEDEVARQDQQRVTAQDRAKKDGDDEPDRGERAIREGDFPRVPESFNAELGQLMTKLDTILNQRPLVNRSQITGLASNTDMNVGISDLPSADIQRLLDDINPRLHRAESIFNQFDVLFKRASGNDLETVRGMESGNIVPPLDRYLPALQFFNDMVAYNQLLEDILDNRPISGQRDTERPPSGTMGGGEYPARDRTPKKDRPPAGTISEEPTDYDPDQDDPEFVAPAPAPDLQPIEGESEYQPPSPPTEDPQIPLPSMPQYPTSLTAANIAEFRDKLDEYLDDNQDALMNDKVAFGKYEELFNRAQSDLQQLGQEFTRPEGSTLPRHTRAELKEMDTRNLEQEYDQVADHFENYGQVVAGRADQFEMSDSNRQLLEGYMDDIRNELELRQRQQEGGTSLEEEMGGGRGHGAEEYPREEWTGYSPSKQEINIPNPNLPTTGEIGHMIDPQLQHQRNRLLQYQQDWGMELSLEQGRKIGATLRDIDDQLEEIRSDPNRYERDEREPQQPPPYITPLPKGDREVDSYVIQVEGLGFPSYVLEEPVVNYSIRKLLGRGIRPRSILEGYTYFLNIERERDARFSIQGNMDKLAQFYNRAIPNAATANEFNHRLDKSWSLLESSTGRRPILVPPTPPEVSPPEEPMRETDPAFMGASHIPAPSPDEMYGGERLIYEGVRDMFEDPANLPYDPRDTRGQLPQTGRP